MIKSITRCCDGIIELECFVNGNVLTIGEVFRQFTERKWYVYPQTDDPSGQFSADLMDWVDYQEAHGPIILGFSPANKNMTAKDIKLTEVIESISSDVWTDDLLVYWDCDCLTVYFMGQYEPLTRHFKTKGHILKESKFPSHCHQRGIVWPT